MITIMATTTKKKPNRFVLDDPDAIEVVSKPKKTPAKKGGSKK